MPETHIVKDNFSNLDDFLAHANDYKLDDVESRLKRFYADFAQFKENNGNLVSKRNEALEELYVVKTAMHQIGHRSNGRSQVAGETDEFEYEATRSLLGDDDSKRRAGETMF